MHGFLVEMVKILTGIPALHQSNLFDTDLLLQRNPTDPLPGLSALTS